MGYVSSIKDEQPMIYANRQVLQQRKHLTLEGVSRPEFLDVLEAKNPYGNYFMRYEQIAKHKLEKQQKHKMTAAAYAAGPVSKKEMDPEAVRRMESKITKKGSFVDQTI